VQPGQSEPSQSEIYALAALLRFLFRRLELNVFERLDPDFFRHATGPKEEAQAGASPGSEARHLVGLTKRVETLRAASRPPAGDICRGLSTYWYCLRETVVVGWGRPSEESERRFREWM
jgi:hypothetical protein